MKNLKKIFAAFLLLIVALTSLLTPASVSAATVNKTIMQYTSQNLTFKKPESASYKCSVSGNEKNYIKIDANNEGKYYWLYINAKKVTPEKNKPSITIYEEANGKKTTIKKFVITVSPAKTVKFSNVKINNKTAKTVTLKTPYDNEYKFKYNKKVASIKGSMFYGDKAEYIIKGLKKGTTTVKVYLDGTNKKVGSFKITVGDYKAGIKKKYKSINLYYNPHIKSTYLKNGSIDLSKAISNYHSNGKYTIKIDNKKIASSTKTKKTALTPEAVMLLSKKTGKTKITIYEKRGKAKKKKIGTINLVVKKAKDSAVYNSNLELDNDGIFYERFISPGESFNLKEEIVSRYINNSYSGSKFKDSEYKITYSASPSDIVSVDKNGIVKCLALDNKNKNRINYSVTFSDGSKVSGSGALDIWELEERPDIV